MIELSILKFFTKDITFYIKYYNIIKNISLEKELKIILSLIHKYYTLFPNHSYIGKEEFIAFFISEYSQLKQKDEYLQIINRMYEVDVSGSLVSDLIIKVIEIHTANKLVNELLPIVSGQQFNLLEKVEQITDEFKSVVLPPDNQSPFVESSLEDLFQHKATDGLSWRLSGLQDAIGCLPGGKLLHVFARPETGKTTLLHSEASNFVHQMNNDHPLLWINNEEDANTVMLRFYSAVCGASVEEIALHKEKAEAMFHDRGGKRMKLYDVATISVDEIEKLCREYTPRLVLIDQGDKVSYKKQDQAGNGAERLKHLYDELRRVTKACNVDWKMDMITVGQADVACEGRKWLYQANLDGGKTGKAGAFDCIIGIGKTYNEAEEHVRFISLCKNKLTGRHNRFISTIDALKARYV